MAKQSAGILLYKLNGSQLGVFLVHPGGPFWAKKDAGSWSVPKGEYHDDEDPLVAARREFKEETGSDAPRGKAIELGEVKYSNKVLTVWALAGELDARAILSNTFQMEWPPRSGTTQEFPEVDRAGWFDPLAAEEKLVKGQQPLIGRLLDRLDVPRPSAELVPPTQSSQLRLF